MRFPTPRPVSAKYVGCVVRREWRGYWVCPGRRLRRCRGVRGIPSGSHHGGVVNHHWASLGYAARASRRGFPRSGELGFLRPPWELNWHDCSLYIKQEEWEGPTRPTDLRPGSTASGRWRWSDGSGPCTLARCGGSGASVERLHAHCRGDWKWVRIPAGQEGVSGLRWETYGRV